jgi:competence ComEA-like helix-hairpin-helix protein
MKTIIREFLTYSKTEQRGIIVLCSLILVVQATRHFYPYFQSDTFPISIEQQAGVVEWVKRTDSLNQQSNGKKYSSGYGQYKQKIELHPFKFNPNTLEESRWVEMGFTVRDAASIQKFRSKGGKFKQKEDLKKLYCVSPDRYSQLETYIQLPEVIEAKQTVEIKEKYALKVVRVELNKADTFELQTLKGIGKYWARRIYKYREQLGGFYRSEQLLEMKGFPDSIFQQIKSLVFCDENRIRKIPLNTIPLEELNKHPYCWYGVGKTIVNYRTKHGPFSKPEELIKIYNLRPETYEKLVHYLTFE